MSQVLGIIVALPAEATVLTQLKLKQHIPVNLTKNVLLIMSGMGGSNAEKATQLLIKKGVTALLSFGTTGGISPDCAAGDVVLANSCIDKELQSIAVDSEWQQRILNTLMQVKSLNIITGAICETPTVIANSSDKNKLFFKSKSIAVDMESATLARIANQNTISFISLRVIVDPADMNIPAIVINNMDENGNVAIKKLLTGLLKQPFAIIPLIKLAKNFSKATKSMSKCKNALGINFLV